METFGFLVLKDFAASVTSGARADEPAAVMLPDKEALAVGVLVAAVLFKAVPVLPPVAAWLPHPAASAVTRETASINANNFFIIVFFFLLMFFIL